MELLKKLTDFKATIRLSLRLHIAVAISTLAIFGLMAALNGAALQLTGEGFDPKSSKPVAAQPVIHEHCPSGWEDNSAGAPDTLVLSCIKGKWIVILTTEGEFDHAFQLDTPGSEFIFDPARIPGWN